MGFLRIPIFLFDWFQNLKYVPAQDLFALDFSKRLLILLRGKTKSKIFVKAKRQRQPVRATKKVRQETFLSFKQSKFPIRF